jgi:ribonuclease P protein component
MLTRPQDFAMLQQRGINRSHPLLATRILRTELGVTRFGLATGRALGSAVDRNRVRRRLREAIRALGPVTRPGWDVLVVARPAITKADHRTVAQVLRRLLAKGGVVQEDGQTSVARE